jgi:O-acetyl-ADP-ribose deacetylase
LFARPEIMGHPDATDLTGALRAAQTGRDQGTYREIDSELPLWTPLRILQGIQVLHQRGYHAARILPGMSASGGYWRMAIAAAADFQTDDGYLDLRDWDSAVNYSTGDGTQFAGSRVDASTSPDAVADLILSALPRLPAAEDDPVYVEWYARLMRSSRSITISRSPMPTTST